MWLASEYWRLSRIEDIMGYQNDLSEIIFVANIWGPEPCCCCLPSWCADYFTCNVANPQPDALIGGDCECPLHDNVHVGTIGGSFPNTALASFSCRGILPGICCCNGAFTSYTWGGFETDCVLEKDIPTDPDEHPQVTAVVQCCPATTMRDAQWSAGFRVDVGWPDISDYVPNAEGCTTELPKETFSIEYAEPPAGSVIRGSATVDIYFPSRDGVNIINQNPATYICQMTISVGGG